MKKLLLLVVSVFALYSLNAQISEDFEAYNVGDKLAEAAQNIGNDYWTTWSNAPGGAEDAVIAEHMGSKVAHFTYGNDQVLLLGDKIAGHYTVAFDVYVADGKNGYFNMLHKFAGSSSEWGFETYLNSTQNGSMITANGTNNTFAFPLDTWVPILLDFDLDNDVMTVKVNDTEVYSGQFSAQATGGAGTRKLAAIDFFPPENVASSEFYVDNIEYVVLAEGTIELVIPTDPINKTLAVDEQAEESLTIQNNGTGIGDYSAYITFDAAGSGTNTQQGELAYCNFGNDAGALGFSQNLPVTIELANKYPVDFYRNFIGASINTISYYTTLGVPENNKYIFRVYGQGTSAEPGDILAEIEVTDYIAGGWNTFDLPEPVLLEGGDIWISVEFTQVSADGYLAAFENQSINNPVNSDWIRTRGGSWAQLTVIQHDDFPIVNWLLKAGYQGPVIPANWVTITNDYYGTVVGGGSTDINLNFNATGLEVGEYNAKINVRSNDDNNPFVQVPVKLTVEPGSGIVNITNLGIYPNPAKDFVNVTNSSNIDELFVYNTLGQVVYKAENCGTQCTVNVANFSAGVYIIVAKSADSINKIKFVVE